MKFLLVLCARANSTRMLGRHHKDVCGMPMWCWASRACWDVVRDRKDTMVVVSTDDEKILGNIPKPIEIDDRICCMGLRRPANLAGDKSPIHEALQHAVVFMDKEAEWVGFIPANVPTVTSKLILRCMEVAETTQADAVITTRRVHDHPAWMWDDAGGVLVSMFPNMQQVAYRMQDLAWPVIATGSVNLVRREVLMACNTPEAFKWLGEKIVGVNDSDAIEVHDEADLDRARLAIHWRRS